MFLLRPNAAQPPSLPSPPRSMAPSKPSNASLSSATALPGICPRFRPLCRRESPPIKVSMELQICRRLVSSPFRAPALARSGTSSAASLFRLRFRPGEVPPHRKRPRQEPEPPDDESLFPWPWRFTTEMASILTRRHRYRENRVILIQASRNFAGSVQLKTAASFLLCFGGLGFYGKRCKSVLDLLKMTPSSPNDTFGRRCDFVRYLLEVLPPDPRYLLIPNLWVPMLFGLDLFRMILMIPWLCLLGRKVLSTTFCRGAGKIKTAEDAENGVLSGA